MPELANALAVAALCLEKELRKHGAEIARLRRRAFRERLGGAASEQPSGQVVSR